MSVHAANVLPSLSQFDQLANQANFPNSTKSEEPLKEAFTDFVGQSLFGQMMAAMRKTVGPPAYFNGGQAEKIFQGQLDQTMVDEITEASADRIADPMYELFRLGRP